MTERLTNREQEIYNYLMRGMSYADIADKLIIEKSTAATHVYKIFFKKLVNSRYELMAQRISELEEEIENLKRTISNTEV